MTCLEVIVRKMEATLRRLNDAREELNRSFCAAAFAEADCPNLAAEMMVDRRTGAVDERPPQSVTSFLRQVGLKGVRVRYFAASVENTRPSRS